MRAEGATGLQRNFIDPQHRGGWSWTGVPARGRGAGSGGGRSPSAGPCGLVAGRIGLSSLLSRTGNQARPLPCWLRRCAIAIKSSAHLRWTSRQNIHLLHPRRLLILAGVWRKNPPLKIKISGQHHYVANGQATWPSQHEHYHVRHFTGLEQTSRLFGFLQLLGRPVRKECR